MKIRSFRDGDEEAMSCIAPCAFMGLGLARYAIDRQLDREKVAGYYAREIRGYADRVKKGEESMKIFVAEDDNETAGYIVVAVDAANTAQFGIKWGRIVSLAVDPRHQFKGIGKSLVHRGLDWLSSEGVRYVEVLTDQNNVGAQRAYEANGFRAVYASISFSRWLEPTS